MKQAPHSINSASPVDIIASENSSKFPSSCCSELPPDNTEIEQNSASKAESQTPALNAVMAAARILLEQKGLDVRPICLKGLSDIADYFVIASGSSDRHICGMADKVKNALLQLGEKPQSISGYEHGEWILMDYGDFVVHIFYEPTRQYYQFDLLWSKAEVVPLPSELEPLARKLRTGLFL